MNKFLSRLTSHVGPTRLTFLAAFLVVLLVVALPHRQEGARWNGTLDGDAQVLSSGGPASPALEGAEFPQSGPSASASDRSVPASERHAPSLENQAPIGAASAAAAVRAGFIRETETSSADNFGLPPLGSEPSMQRFGFESSGRGRGATPASFASAGGSAGSGSSAGGGSAKAESHDTHHPTQHPENAATVADFEDLPLVDTVPDPSPVLHDPVPFANAPIAEPQSGRNSPEDSLLAPSSSDGASSPAFPRYGDSSLNESGQSPTELAGVLDPNSRAADLLAEPEASDLPKEAHLSGSESPTASHVPDHGGSLLLFGGGLVGIVGFRRWHNRLPRSLSPL